MAEEKKNGGWFSTFLRFGCLIAALVGCLDLVAAPRVWTLNSVQFSDGAIATGYFGYDDATRVVTNWDVRVSQGPLFPELTYILGNSAAYYTPGWIYFVSGDAPPGLYRFLNLWPSSPLDGSNPTVSLDLAKSYEDYEELIVRGSRGIISGSLVLTALTLPVARVQVDEFYNQALRHYFITADAVEKQDLDTGARPGWARTGESFNAYTTGSNAGDSINPVCRYYGNSLRGIDSHFYSADAAECLAVHFKYPSDWQLESDNVFQTNLPDTVTGACPSGTVPVYRLWNQRRDSNHRYTTRAAIKEQMLAIGYFAEGYGPDGVAMCAVN